jgi:hypothetical protein
MKTRISPTRFALTLALCTVLSVAVNAQSYFYNGIPDVPNYKSAAVFPHPLGFVLLLKYDSAGFAKNTIMLFDESGSVVWRKKLSGTAFLEPASIHFFEDNSFAIAGEEVISDSVKNAFVCKFNVSGVLTWGKKIITPRPINVAGPIVEDSSRIFATLNMKRKLFGSEYFEDALISVFNTSGGQEYNTGLISNTFAREFKLTHSTIAQNGDFLGLISYRVNASSPGAGFVLIRMSNEGDLRFSYSINLNQDYRFGSTRGIFETQSGKIIIACQLDSANTDAIKPGYLAMFADSGVILKQRIVGFTNDFSLQVEQLGNSIIGVPKLFCSIEEDGQRFWAVANVDTADLSLYDSRRLPISLDIAPIDESNTIRNAAVAANSGGLIATSGLYCASELKRFPTLMQWSSENTLECQTLSASAYFEDSVVNYQISNYALTPIEGIITQNFSANLVEEIKPFIQNLCSGCANLTSVSEIASASNYSAFPDPESRAIQLLNKGETTAKWQVFGSDGRLLENGTLGKGILQVPVQNSGVYIVIMNDKVLKIIIP